MGLIVRSVCLFELNIPPTAKVIWGRGHISLTDWRSRGSNLQLLSPVVYPLHHSGFLSVSIYYQTLFRVLSALMFSLNWAYNLCHYKCWGKRPPPQLSPNMHNPDPAHMHVPFSHCGCDIVISLTVVNAVLHYAVDTHMTGKNRDNLPLKCHKLIRCPHQLIIKHVLQVLSVVQNPLCKQKSLSNFISSLKFKQTNVTCKN